MKSLDKLLEKCGFVKRSKVDYDYRPIESLVGFSLPTDYRYYLENYEPYDGFIGKAYLVIEDFSAILPHNEALYSNKDLPHTLLIGSNGASESIGIRFTGEDKYQVVIAQYISEIDDQIIIGDSFTDMLIRLDSGREWFS